MRHTTVLHRDRATSLTELGDRAEWIRLETIRLVDIAKSGHYSSVFSCAELLAALYYNTMRLDPAVPSWPDRDRLLLGKGHVAIGIYPCLADLGYFPVGWLDSYTRLGSPLGDHPDMTKVPGIDFSSGSIGHNLSVGIGMALNARRRGSNAVIRVLLGDQELNEGQIWEAAMAAAHFGLSNLVAIVDANGWGLDGPVGEVMGIEPVREKFQAFGWTTDEVDGHDTQAVVGALRHDPSASRPHAIVARTQKGRGVSFMEQTPFWHLGYLGPEDRQRAETEIRARMTAG